MKAYIIIFGVLFFVQNAPVYGITGGEPAADGEFPFVVSIRQNDNCHYCTGTIISDRWIMTANICYSRAFFGLIRFGTNKLDNTTSPSRGSCAPYDSTIQRHTDEAIYNPDAWDAPPWTHDMVLIHLNESISFGDNVQPVKLPEVDEPWPDYQTGTIVGWGYENGEVDPMADGLRTDLHKAQVPLFSEEYCSNSSIWGGWVVADPAVMKCGGEVNKTYYCGKDYGGPLVVDGKQYGIISYIRTDPGGYCGNYLGIFSPVSYFRQWIKDTTGV